MKVKQILSEALSQKIFLEVYGPLGSPKRTRKALGLMEAAIEEFAAKGLNHASAESIARTAGVQRTVIYQYFKSIDDLRSLCVRYIRLRFQEVAIQAICTFRDSERQLQEYVAACFFWSRVFPTHARVWIYFLIHCSRDQSLRESNAKMSAMGAQRIGAMIEAIVGIDQLESEEIENRARAIQGVITGALIVAVTDSLESAQWIRSTQSLCLKIAKTGCEDSQPVPKACL